jgi:hypothetical protein
MRWASANNLKLNRAKTIEIIFVDKSRRLQSPTPPLMAGINRDTSLKILGVRVNSSLTFSEHLREVLRSCANTVYALLYDPILASTSLSFKQKWVFYCIGTSSVSHQTQ